MLFRKEARLTHSGLLPAVDGGEEEIELSGCLAIVEVNILSIDEMYLFRSSEISKCRLHVLHLTMHQNQDIRIDGR